MNITDCGASIASGSGGSTLLSTFGPLVISNTLYYAATGGQTVFNLGAPDKFGHTGVLADHNVLVYEGGGRQVPYDNYVVSVGANTVTFNAPLIAGEIAVFDIVNPPRLRQLSHPLFCWKAGSYRLRCTIPACKGKRCSRLERQTSLVM